MKFIRYVISTFGTRCCTDGLVCQCNIRTCKCRCPGCFCG